MSHPEKYAGLPLYHQEFPGIKLDFAERRRKPRLAYPYPALVRGVDGDGKSFEQRTSLIDISASGLGLSLSRPLAIESRVLVIFRFSMRHDVSAPCIAVKASVTRIQSHPELSYYVAMVVKQHRFIWSDEWEHSFRSYFLPMETHPELESDNFKLLPQSPGNGVII